MTQRVILHGISWQTYTQRLTESDTPDKAGGLMSGTASKAVDFG
jgi:hypothetical protein